MMMVDYPSWLLSISDILDGSETTVKSLGEKAELLQFWKMLSGFVDASSDERRVDLVGSRVVEDPREGAALLQVSIFRSSPLR